MKKFNALTFFICAYSLGLSAESTQTEAALFGMQDMKFAGDGMIFTLSAKSYKFYYNTKDTHNYCDIEPNRQIKIKFGDSIFFPERHVIFSISSESFKRFIVTQGFNAFSFGDGEWMDFFLIYEIDGKAHIRKIGKYGEGRKPVKIGDKYERIEQKPYDFSISSERMPNLLLNFFQSPDGTFIIDLPAPFEQVSLTKKCVAELKNKISKNNTPSSTTYFSYQQHKHVLTDISDSIWLELENAISASSKSNANQIKLAKKSSN